MTNQVVNNSSKTLENKASAKSDIILFKCTDLFNYSVYALLEGHSNYRLKSIDCLERLEEHIAVSNNCIVVIQDIRLSEIEWQVQKIITDFKHVKLLFVFEDNKLNINNEFLRASCFAVFFMRSATNQFFSALQALENNQIYIPFLELTGDLTTAAKKNVVLKNREGLFQTLSERQYEVTELLCLGYNQNTIANNLGVSVQWVWTLRKKVFRKLKVDSVYDLKALGNRYNVV